MSYVNMDIRDRSDERAKAATQKAELEFWRGEAMALQMKLENIPRAIREWGYVQIWDGDEKLTLVAKDSDHAKTE